jgi:hypothetical protein
MQLRPDYRTVIARTKAFYATPRRGAALVQVLGGEGISLQSSKPLEKWKLPGEMIPYIDDRAAAVARFWEQRRDLDDDLIPAIAPWYGIAEHTAFLGGEVEFTGGTSFNHQILSDWKDFDNLKLDKNHPWLRLVIDGMRHCREKWGNLFAAKLRGADGPLDIANIVRGNDLFTDIYDHPDELHKLMDFCAAAARFTMDRQLQEATILEGGVITGFDIWLPLPCAGHLSDDASCMMSVENYEEFGLPYMRKVCAAYENVMLHTHSLGKKNIPQFASVPQIKWLQISSDPNSDRAIDVYREYEEVLRDKIVVVELTRREIEDNLDLLKRNKTHIWHTAPSMEAARETVRLVREELPVDF